MNKYNSEKYPDPTVEQASKNIKHYTGHYEPIRPLVYICSPYSVGDVLQNIDNAQMYSRKAALTGLTPIAPHLLFTQFLDDSDDRERDIGLKCGLSLIGKCTAVWVFGDNITTGMQAEIDKAKKKRVPIRYFDERGNLKDGQTDVYDL